MLTLVSKRLQARCKQPASTSPGGGSSRQLHPCLGIEESLEAPDLQRPIRQASAGQHRDGVAATHAQEALDAEALASGRFAEAPIEAMTVEPPRTPSRAVRPIPFEAVSTDLDALLRTPLSPTHQARLSARTRDLLTPPKKKRQPSTPTKNPGPPHQSETPHVVSYNGLRGFPSLAPVSASASPPVLWCCGASKTGGLL